MEGLLLRLLILFRSVDEPGRHGQFLFLIARFLKICETFTIKIAHFVLIH
jgi:hypothetical protein